MSNSEMKNKLKRLEFVSSSDFSRLSHHDYRYDTVKAYYQTFDFINLRQKWPNIIGERLAEVTSPLKISKDVLIILSRDANYSHHLSFLSEEIKKNIFSYFAELKPVIKKLAFQTKESYFLNSQHLQVPNNEFHKSEKLKVLHPQSPVFKRLKCEADELFSHIEDEELKSTLISLFIQTRQSH